MGGNYWTSASANGNDYGPFCGLGGQTQQLAKTLQELSKQPVFLRHRRAVDCFSPGRNLQRLPAVIPGALRPRVLAVEHGVQSVNLRLRDNFLVRFNEQPSQDFSQSVVHGSPFLDVRFVRVLPGCKRLRRGLLKRQSGPRGRLL